MPCNMKKIEQLFYGDILWRCCSLSSPGVKFSPVESRLKLYRGIDPYMFTSNNKCHPKVTRAIFWGMVKLVKIFKIKFLRMSLSDMLGHSI